MQLIKAPTEEALMEIKLYLYVSKVIISIYFKWSVSNYRTHRCIFCERIRNCDLLYDIIVIMGSRTCGHCFFILFNMKIIIIKKYIIKSLINIVIKQ